MFFNLSGELAFNFVKELDFTFNKFAFEYCNYLVFDNM